MVPGQGVKCLVTAYMIMETVAGPDKEDTLLAAFFNEYLNLEVR